MQRIVAMEDRVYDLEKAMERAALIAAVDHVDHRIAQLEEMVYQALEAVDVDMQITRRTVENELAETAEVLGAFEYQDTIYDEEVRRLRGEASLEIATLRQRIQDMDGELKIALKQKDLVRKSHGLAKQRTGILQLLLKDTERELQKTVIERDMALLLNDELELAIDDAGHRHTQELNALTEAHNIALQAASERAEIAERIRNDAVRQHEQEMETAKEVHRTEIQATRREKETAQAELFRQFNKKIKKLKEQHNAEIRATTEKRKAAEEELARQIHDLTMAQARSEGELTKATARQSSEVRRRLKSIVQSKCPEVLSIVNDSIILAYIDLENVAETYRGTPLDFPPLTVMLYGHNADDASTLWTLAAVGLQSNSKIAHLTPAETSIVYPWLIESCGWFLVREMATPRRLAVAFLQLLNFHGIAMSDPDVDVACRGVVEKAQDLTDMIAQSNILTPMYKDLVDWIKHEKSWADTAIQLARDNDCLLESMNSGTDLKWNNVA